MNRADIQTQLQQLKTDFEGDIYIDEPTLLMYATDASAYREVPLAVTRPKTKKDIHRFHVELECKWHRTGLVN